MGIMDDANDMKKKTQDKLDDTQLDDKAKERIEKMRRDNNESVETTTDYTGQ